MFLKMQNKLKQIIDFFIPEKKKKFMYLCRLLPVDRKKAVFVSFLGKGYSDNPRAIYEEMVVQHPDMHFIWLMQDTNIHIEHAVTVKYGSLKSLYHLATAKLWVDNCRKEHWIPKRKEQYYVQTWHGDIALKKVEKDAQETLSEGYLKNCYNDSKIADLFLAGSEWRAENYRKSFWYNGEILMFGTPKSDIFYRDHNQYKIKVCEYFDVAYETKFCLYVPTFRNDMDVSCYDIDFEMLKTVLEKKWGNGWKILVKLHPNIQHMQSSLEYNDTILNATTYNETNELIVSSDLLITDYSSCMFDGLEAKTRVLLYASDMNDYLEERKFYFNIEELPFLFSDTMDGLFTNIIDFDDNVYFEKIAAFSEILGICNGADGTAKVTEYIYEKIKERN